MVRLAPADPLAKHQFVDPALQRTCQDRVFGKTVGAASQRREHYVSEKQRNEDPQKTVSCQAAQAFALVYQGSREPGSHEEGRHREAVQEDGDDIETDVGLRILEWTWKRDVGEQRVPEHHDRDHRRPKVIDGVITRLLVSHSTPEHRWTTVE